MAGIKKALYETPENEIAETMQALATLARQSLKANTPLMRGAKFDFFWHRMSSIADSCNIDLGCFDPGEITEAVEALGWTVEMDNDEPGDSIILWK